MNLINVLNECHVGPDRGCMGPPSSCWASEGGTSDWTKSPVGGMTPRASDPVTLTPPHPPSPLCPNWRWLEVGLLPAAIYLPPSLPPSSVMSSAVPCRQGSLTECLLCYGFIGLVCGRNLWIKVISHCSTFSQAVKLPFTFVPLAERDRERHM